MARRATFSSAPCGAGKTFWIAETAREIIKRGRNVLIIQPTKLLADKTADEEFIKRPNCPPLEVFHSGTVGRGVGKELADHLAETGWEQQVVIATHQVLPLLTHRTNLHNWALMIDESPQVERSKTHSFLHTHGFLTDCVEIEPVDDVYGKVIVTDEDQLKAIARNKDDDELWSRLQETARILINDHWDSYVRIEQFHRLLSGEGQELTFHSLLQPTVIDDFASVFMAAANFEDSAAYHLWGRSGFCWKEDVGFTEKLRFSVNPNGHLATIHYATEQDWSSKLSDKTVDDISNLDRVRSAADKLLDVENRLWQGNVRLRDGFFKGDRLPNNPLGLNLYSGVDDLAFFSALNPTPEHGRFLRQHGITYEQVSRMNYCSTLYQAAMRTSLRDPTSTNMKRIVTMDRRGAEFLREKLPGAVIQKLETGIIETDRIIGRPRIHKNDAEKGRLRRETEKEKRRIMMLEMLAIPISQDHGGVAEGNTSNLRTEMGIDLITPFDTQLPYHGTIYLHKKTSQPEWYLFCENPDAFIRFIELCFQQKYSTKEKNALISPAIFDPERAVFNSSGKRLRRGRGNIVYLQNIMLDFEKGNFRPEQFADLFPDLHMIITNTSNHTKDEPRFRAIIPTTRPMTPDVYEAIFDEIVQRMADQGVVKSPRKGSNFLKSGLDHSKRSAASLFYLPCQAQKTEESFFDIYEQDRAPLDPETWLATARLVLKDWIEPTSIQPAQGQYDQTRLDAAVDKWRYGTLPGQGNHQFFLLAVELRKMGMADYEIEAKLREEARYGRSPAKRLAQISSIIETLSKRETKTPV